MEYTASSYTRILYRDPEAGSFKNKNTQSSRKFQEQQNDDEDTKAERRSPVE
jgi:hypothetical protein